ncbi:MAG: DNA-methyltransferase [Candidatus Helarchaeota archaeon]
MSKKSMKKIKIANQTIFFKSSESMNEIPNDKIDVIITSPPYNRRKHYDDEYNDDLPEIEYFNLLSRVFSECYRVLKKNSLFFLNIGDSANDQGISEKVAQLAEKVGFNRIQSIIWVKSLLGKGHYTPSGRNKRLNNIWEFVFLFSKGKNYELDVKSIGIRYADKSNIGRYSNEDLRDAGNVWLINYVKTTGKTIKKGHEAPFPIELPYRCIKLAKATNVLDPFAGTGSTLAAAHYLGIPGFGYEKYHRISVIKDRILNSNFIPQKQNLIPDLEKSVIYLNEILIKTGNLERIVKKQLNLKKITNLKKLETIQRTLQCLNIENPNLDLIINQLMTKSKNYLKKSKSLSDFLS